MVNFSGYVKAFNALREAKSPIFDNIEEAWLPPNTTSRYQPCDQGIVATVKTLYRRKWVNLLLDEWEEDRNARQIMNVLRCVKWMVEVWNEDMKGSAIYNCFQKATA